MNRCYFIILTFNPDLSLLKKNLHILENDVVIVVDNSQKEVKKKLEGLVSKNCRLIANEKNLGYSEGMNAGMKYAFAQGAEWVVLLNQDVELSKQAITILRTKLHEQPPAITGPWAGYLDKRRWTTNLFPRQPQGIGQQSFVDYISGSFFALHKDVFKATGGFYPDFFMYYEDVDLCRRAAKIGFPLVPIELTGIHHEEGSSIKRGSELHQYYLARNHFLFIERNAPIAVRLYEVGRFPKTFWEHISRKERGALLGIFDYIFRRFGAQQRSL